MILVVFNFKRCVYMYRMCVCVCALSPFKNVQEAFAPGCAFTPLEALQDTFLLKPSALIQAIQERWTAGGLAFRRGGCFMVPLALQYPTQICQVRVVIEGPKWLEGSNRLQSLCAPNLSLNVD